MLTRHREVLGLPTGASEGARLELEVGDIALGVEVRSESSPVEKGTKGDEEDVKIAVRRRQQTVLVVRLQFRAKPPDRSGIGGQVRISMKVGIVNRPKS